MVLTAVIRLFMAEGADAVRVLAAPLELLFVCERCDCSGPSWVLRHVLGHGCHDLLFCVCTLSNLVTDGILTKGHALHRRVLDARLIADIGNAIQSAPFAPGKTEAAALVEASGDEADAGRLSVRGRKEAAAGALLARVHITTAAGADHVGILDRVDAAGAVNTGLGGVELGRVEGGILEPADGHLVVLWSWKGVVRGGYIQYSRIKNQFYAAICSS